MIHVLRAPALLSVFIALVQFTAFAAAAEMKMTPKPQHAASVAFDAAGRLWRVRVADGRLVVDASDDRGATFSAPVAVAAEPIAADGELRPEIAVSQDRRIYVAWTSPLPQRLAGNARFARSLDGGKTFEAPITVNDNREAITHRFQSMSVAPDGRITLVWIDKRDLEAAKRAGKDYRGAALYYAVSTDGGASFGANALLAAHSCECCRIALAADTDGTPLAFWRHVFPDGTRDHALVRVAATADGDTLPRATHERWQINACPHHGPDLSVAADGTRHGVWFNQAGGEAGLYYGAWDKQGRPRGPARRFAQAGAAHPAVLADGDRVRVAWKIFDGEKTVIRLIESGDAGRSWSPPRVVAGTEHTSDHPRLVGFRGDTYLSWSTAHEGHRLIPLVTAQGGR